MKKFISLTSLLLISVFILSVSSCKKKDPVEDVLYDLKVVNNLDQDLDLYLKSDVDNTGFTKTGYVTANGKTTIKDLTIQVNYTLRGVVPGNPIAGYEFEETFSSDNNVDDYLLTIGP